MESKLKILMVNDKLSIDGGAEQYLFDVSNELTQRGHTVLKATEAEDIIGLVKKEKPDVVNLQNVFRLSLYQFLPTLVPTIHYIHDHRTYSPGPARLHFNSNTICDAPLSLGHSLLYAYTQKCMSRNPFKIISTVLHRKKLTQLQNKLAKVVANSNYVREKLIENGVEESIISVIHPAIYPGVAREKIKTTKPLILYAGRLFVEKGVDFLIMAMQAVPAAECLIVGSGWDEKRLKDLVKRLKLQDRVKIIPWVGSSRVADYYQAATIGVVPSVWPEPFGLSGITFMSFGKPVVGFDVGGIKEWLNDEQTGYLIPRADPSKLAQKINYLLSNKDVYKKMSLATKKEFDTKFTIGIHVDKLLELYSEVIR